jgi:hypothetical protein
MEGRGRSQSRRGGSKWSNGGSVDQWSLIRFNVMRSRIRIHYKVKSRNRIRIKVKRGIRIRIKVTRIRNPPRQVQLGALWFTATLYVNSCKKLKDKYAKPETSPPDGNKEYRTLYGSMIWHS